MTIYALSSGPGISGIAVIRVSGAETSEEPSIYIPMYHHPGTNQYVQHDVQNYTRNWKKVTGDVKTGPDDDPLTILTNLGLTETMRLNAKTQRLLKRTKLTHHVFGRTW